MGIATGQVSSTSNPVLSNATVAALALVPPGPSSIVISNVCGQTVYVGPGTAAGAAPTAAALTAAGFAIPNNAPPVTLQGLNKSGPTQLYVIAAAAPTAGAPVTWAIAT